MSQKKRDENEKRQDRGGLPSVWGGVLKVH